MKQIIVKQSEQGQRIDKYIRKYLNDAPLSFIYKLFRKKDIKVNNKKIDISYIIKNNDIINIYINDDTINDFVNHKTIAKTNNILDIIYEDENILIINKDCGVLVHQGQQNTKTNTLNNDILNYLKNKGEYSETDLFTPSCVHRLDRNTSGLIIASKNLESSKELLELFKDKSKLTKEYLGLVKGKVDNVGTITAPLKKDEKEKFVKVNKNGLTAITNYCLVTTNNKYSLVKFNILTGRTHQIRVHSQYINHPIINDDKYGDFKLNKEFENKYHYKYQLLHSYKISFNNISGKLAYLNNKTFIAPLKKKEKEIINDLFKDCYINKKEKN